MGPTPAIQPYQCRAARGLLGWTQRDLSEAAGVALMTVSLYESGQRAPMPNNLRAIVAALSEHVVFLPATAKHGPGVRLRK